MLQQTYVILSHTYLNTRGYIYVRDYVSLSLSLRRECILSWTYKTCLPLSFLLTLLDILLSLSVYLGNTLHSVSLSHALKEYIL